MNKIFVMALALLLSSANMSLAQEVVMEDSEIQAEQSQSQAQETTEDVFEGDANLEAMIGSEPIVGPGGIFVSAKELKMSKCHDKDFRQRIISMIDNYQKNNQGTTILSKRNQFLMLKRIVDFEEVSPDIIDPKKDFDLANELIKTKINLGVKSEDMRLCKCTKTVSEKDLYVLMYEKNNIIYGKILNLDTDGVNEELLSFEDNVI